MGRNKTQQHKIAYLYYDFTGEDLDCLIQAHGHGPDGVQHILDGAIDWAREERTKVYHMPAEWTAWFMDDADRVVRIRDDDGHIYSLRQVVDNVYRVRVRQAYRAVQLEKTERSLINKARDVRTSPKMRAIVGYILGQHDWTSPAISSLCVTSDGHVLAGTTVDPMHNAQLGMLGDLVRNLDGFSKAAVLSDKELSHFRAMAKRRIESFGKATDWTSAGIEG